MSAPQPEKNNLSCRGQASTETGGETSGFLPAKSFLSSVLKYSGKRALVYFILTILVGLTEGVGLLMLIPLLHLIGFGEGAPSDSTSVFIGALFLKTGIPFNLTTILCTYMVIVGIFAVINRYLEVLIARLSLGYIQFMQDRVYSAFAGVEWLCSIRTSGADIIRVLTNDLIRLGTAARHLLDGIAVVALTLIYVGVVLWISPVMAIFILLSTAVILIFLQPFNRQAHSLGEVFHAETSKLYFVASEHVNGMKVAKSYGLEAEHIERFSAITEQIAEKGVRFLQVDSTTQMFHRIGATVALSVFFFVGAGLLAIPSSYMILLVVVFARFSPKVSLIQHHAQFVNNCLPVYRAATLMLRRFEESGESPPRSPVQPLRLDKGIRFNQVSFSYDGPQGPRSLCQIDLLIPARSTVAVMGPSGSGKSTLADLLMGLLTPTEGTICLDERPLTGELLYNWRRSIGYVPQETFLFNETIRGNLLLVRPGASDDELWEALENAAASGFVQACPDGLETLVGDRGVRLSGGERQRIALARALLRKPAVLILDEATSSLDRENEAQVLGAIERLHGELTMVVIAHRPSTVRKADTVVVLEQGRIVETGTWHSLSYKKGGQFLRRMAQQD
ncbi:MAG: ABC transporter ATP-binding protein [Syntrophobacteraceae bacterium]|nr:ABC transporter ATP-binding protein [Syntrophobacteraceae bacterium]